MDIGSIFLVLALTILVGLYIIRPLVEQRNSSRRVSASVVQEEQELSTLLAERDRALTALQELDFDFTLGKIPEGEYPAQRATLLQRGADILRRLDSIQGSQSLEMAEDRLEAAIAERRRAQASVAGGGNGRSGNGSSPDDQVEALIAARRRNRQGKAAGFCHKCGGPLQRSDSFCPKCGTAIK